MAGPPRRGVLAEMGCGATALRVMGCVAPRRGRGPGPHIPGATSAQPRLALSSQGHRTAGRPNHDDVTLPWSGPRRCDIAVVVSGAAGAAVGRRMNGARGQAMRSMMVALAMPPPSHIVCRPY